MWDFIDLYSYEFMQILKEKQLEIYNFLDIKSRPKGHYNKTNW
jgi:hypothetical protein